MIATQAGYLIAQLIEQHAVYNAGMAVVFNHEKRLIRTYRVKLLTAYEPPLLYGIGRSTKADYEFFLCIGKIGTQHTEDLRVGLGLHDV